MVLARVGQLAVGKLQPANATGESGDVRTTQHCTPSARPVVRLGAFDSMRQSMIRYDTIRNGPLFNTHSKADRGQLNLPHETKKKQKR